MTATQHGGTLRDYISSLHYYKKNACFFSFVVFFTNLMLLFFLCDLVSPSTGCKSQLFLTLAGVAILAVYWDSL
jgi:hypothetical protein